MPSRQEPTTQTPLAASVVALLTIACARPAPAPSLGSVSAAGATDCSARVEEARVAADLPALSVSLARDGQILAWGASGERIAGGGEPVTLHDKWHIGSDTKAMTAHLAALSVARGEIAWDTSVAEVFAELEPAEGWETVTLLDLVRHQSGLPQLSTGAKQYMLVMHSQPTHDLRSQWVEKQVLPSSPSENRAFSYANSNYMLVGAMLEARSGESWETLLFDRLFTPLGMTGAGLGIPGEGHPRGHRRHSDGQWAPSSDGAGADNVPALGPAGTVHTDHQSWAAFAQAQLEVLHAGDAADPALSQLFAVPDDSPYAGGWIHLDEPPGGLQGPAWTHGGSNGMWFALATLLPEYSASFFCTSNALDASVMGPECARLMAELVKDHSEGN